MTNKPPPTLAEFFCPMANRELGEELEQFRVRWERMAGRRADITKRYTSQLPMQVKDWLVVNHTERYFEGLPEFVKAYYRDKVKLAESANRSDEIPEPYRRAYRQGLLNPSEDRGSRLPGVS